MTRRLLEAMAAGIEVLGRLPGASNATFLARAGGDTLVVYKPTAGVRPLWDFDSSTLAMREVLTFEVSEAMSLGAVPETALATGPMGPGAAQLFVDARSESSISPTDDRLWPLAALDLVINNADRKGSHILLTDGEIVGVDHGLTFHPEPKLRTVLWGFAGAPLPKRMISALQALLAALDRGFETEVAKRLDPKASRSLRSRVEDVLADPVHPEPPVDRPALPWPPY